MDKKELKMKAKYFKVMAVVVLLFLIAGCETSKGFSKGIVATGCGVVGGVASTVGGTTVGLAKDAYSGTLGFVDWINSVDGWIKENMW